mgnify:CR=1 FL=1
MAKKIKLTRGYSAVVDDEDYDNFNRFHWHAVGYGKCVYAARNGPKTQGKRKYIYLHREILSDGGSLEIDHINGDGLDNRKLNLRKCTHQQNMFNAKKKHGSSKYKGVYFNKKIKKWCAQIHPNGKRVHIGYFQSEIDAARSYNQTASKLCGEYARLNFLSN